MRNCSWVLLGLIHVESMHVVHSVCGTAPRTALPCGRPPPRHGSGWRRGARGPSGTAGSCCCRLAAAGELRRCLSCRGRWRCASRRRSCRRSRGSMRRRTRTPRLRTRRSTHARRRRSRGSSGRCARRRGAARAVGSRRAPSRRAAGRRRPARLRGPEGRCKGQPGRRGRAWRARRPRARPRCSTSRRGLARAPGPARQRPRFAARRPRGHRRRPQMGNSVSVPRARSCLMTSTCPTLRHHLHTHKRCHLRPRRQRWRYPVTRMALLPRAANAPRLIAVRCLASRRLSWLPSPLQQPEAAARSS
mmetsp:Transcript_21871/g.69028  ORF Transcript_21871/g.69028 Transcript_21871/m.69028 type:complete len:304 (+) Transcript_21871:316-1227(+)